MPYDERLASMKSTNPVRCEDDDTLRQEPTPVQPVYSGSSCSLETSLQADSDELEFTPYEEATINVTLEMLKRRALLKQISIEEQWDNITEQKRTHEVYKEISNKYQENLQTEVMGKSWKFRLGRIDESRQLRGYGMVEILWLYNYN